MEKPSMNDTNQSSDRATPSFYEHISNEIEECDHVTHVKVSKAATLEQRYIELLEKRIACLEEALESQGSEVLDIQRNKNKDEDEEDREGHKNQRRKDKKETADIKEQPMNKDTNTKELNPSDGEALVENNAEPDMSHQGADIIKAATEHSTQTNTTQKAQEQGRIHFTEIRYVNGEIVVTDANAHTEAVADTKGEDFNYAFVWSRVFDKENRYFGIRVRILSEPLADLLKENLSHHLKFPHHEKDIRFFSPFEVLVHNWTKLLGVAEPCSGPNAKQNIARDDLKQLMKQISTSTELSQYFQDFEPALMPKTVTFTFLWTIFPPGCLVYSTPVMQKDQIWVLQSFDEEEHKDSKKRFTLTCWAYDWNGETFNRVPYELHIDSFSGTKSIDTLECYPLEHHHDVKAIRTRLIKRGKKYRDLCIRKSGSQMFDYNGYSIEDQQGITRQETSSREITNRSSVLGSSGEKTASERAISPKFKGHVIIDFFSYNQYVAGGGRMGIKRPVQPYIFCTCATCIENEALMGTTRYHYDRVDENKEFTEEQYLICPPRVLGFFMVRKTWAQLLVENVVYLGKNDGDAFKKLVLERQQKTLIRSLVSRHGEESESREGGSQQVEDIIEGKGKGVVILLHGPPGVGKTLTAENVAQITNKPLFAVSVADIGLKPAEVEANLSQLFNLASIWKAILLFDEADVFLDARDKSDMERNALVSVLLRVMEYYEGILILTTNRIKTFDVAVQSRVNLAIRYQDLSVEDRKKIFRNFYNQLTTENCRELKPIKEYMDDFDEELNGRQIRNVFSSAMALARERDEKVCLKDFKDVVKVTREFQKYLMEESVKARQRME